MVAITVNGQDYTDIKAARKALRDANRLEAKAAAERAMNHEAAFADCDHSVAKAVRMIDQMNRGDEHSWGWVQCEPVRDDWWVQEYETSNGKGTRKSSSTPSMMLRDASGWTIAVRYIKEDEDWEFIGCAGGETAVQRVPEFMRQALARII